MPSTSPQEVSLASVDLGDQAPRFEGLLGTDGVTYSLSSFDDRQLLVLVFTGNGCPTAKLCEDRLIALQQAYEAKGVGLVAVNSNNPYLSPPDTYAEMITRARLKGYNYPYLKDADGAVARACRASCTPYVVLFDRDRRLRYRGRLDDARVASRVTRHDLQEAIEDLLKGGPVAVPETTPFGCSIVW